MSRSYQEQILKDSVKYFTYEMEKLENIVHI